MAKEHVHGVFESIAQQYDSANDRISLGMHRLWKQALEDVAVSTCSHPDAGAGLVLDVARHRTQDLQNVMLVEGNAMSLPFDDDTFDSAVISFGLRNTPDYEQVVGEMMRVVKPGGVVACLDASVPDSKLIDPFYQFYYKNIMTFLGGGFSHHDQYEWLYESTQEFLRKDELKALFEKVGLAYVSVRPFMFGAAALHVGYVPA